MKIVLCLVSIGLFSWLIWRYTTNIKRFNNIKLKYKNHFTSLSDIKEYAIQNNDKELLEEYYEFKKHINASYWKWFLLMLVSCVLIVFCGVILKALGWA